jgi:PHD/YefM family antitoxin component YafN of YafNO toxin-antitoxin module
VSVAEILHQIEALPPKDRWEVLEHTRHLLEAEIPESFAQGMAEIARGDVIELDEALKALDASE